MQCVDCNGQQRVPIVPHREPLQRLIAAEQELDGVRIDVIEKDEEADDTWVLKGIIADKKQLQRLKTIADDYFLRLDEIKPDLTAFFSPHVKIVPLADFRRELQASISESALLSGTRIDRVYYGRDGHLHLEGVFWPTGTNPPSEKDKILNSLVTTTMATVVRNQDRWSELTKGGRVVVDGMQYFPPGRVPLRYVRQMIADDARLDGTHVDETYYGPNGKLIFKGVASDITQNALLRKKINGVAKESANWRAWVGKDSNFEFNVTDFISNRNKTRAIEFAIEQAIFSTPVLVTNPQGNKLPDKVLIKRLYYTADNKLALTGLRWNEISGKNDPTQAGKRALTQLLLAQQSADPGLKGKGVDISGLPLFNSANIPFRSLLAASWDMIPKHRELDGLRLDRAYYQGGVLRFTGIQAKEGQTSQLSARIPLTDPLWKTLAPKGIAFDAFPIVDTETFLDEIQNHYAFHAQTPALDGARLDRIYYQFDPGQQTLRPVFSIDRWHTGQAVGAIQPASIEAVTIQNMLQALPAQWSTVTEWGDPDFQLANEKPSPLPILRQEIAQDKNMDGTRIDRAFYDPSGKLYFEGLIGDEQQLEAVNALVQTTLGRMGGGNDEYAPQGFAVNRDRFRLIPNALVLEWIQDLLPGYKALDGAGVSRLFFTPDNALAVDGRIAVKNQTADISKILGDALQQTSWGRQLMKDNTNELVQTGRFDLFPVRHDPYEAMALLATAWQIFYCGDYESAIKKLDMAILYDPDNTQLWMLRSLCYIGLHKIDYARRDARRAVLSMKNNQYRYHGRYRTLSKVQGPIRLCFEALMQEVWASRANGKIVFLPLPSFKQR